MGDENLEKAIASLSRDEQSLLLELVGVRATTGDSLVETLTAVALATQTPGPHELHTPLGLIRLDVGREGELLNARELDPLRPLRGGLVSGLPAEERPHAFALIVSLAKLDHGAFATKGKRRDLVSLISAALGDALTRR